MLAALNTVTDHGGLLGQLGCTWHPDQFIGRINKMDVNGLDLILGGWAALRAVNPKEMRVIAVDGSTGC